MTTFGDSAGAYPDVPAVNASIGAGLWGTDTVDPGWPEYRRASRRSSGASRGSTCVADAAQPRHLLWSLRLRLRRGAVVLRRDRRIRGERARDAHRPDRGPDRDRRGSRWRRTWRQARRTRSSEATSSTTMEVEGVRLVDWFTALLNGESPADVHCVECNAPYGSGSGISPRRARRATSGRPCGRPR